MTKLSGWKYETKDLKDGNGREGSTGFGRKQEMDGCGDPGCLVMGGQDGLHSFQQSNRYSDWWLRQYCMFCMTHTHSCILPILS